MKSFYNNYRSDSSGKIGAVIMLIFSIYAAYRWNATGFLFFALLFLRDVIAVWFLLTRNPDKKQNEFGLVSILSYVSAAFPFFYLGSSWRISTQIYMILNIFSILGFGLAALALLDLGKSFGVSPANRGKVTSGVYRYFNHPMYIGYAVAEFGLILLNPINAIIYCLSMSLYFYRAKVEEKTLDF
ncbi:MAG TPA: isoprenylcysteine carboxylmethyltransferase family protein [Bacteriovoracaceae bacterium]|nr:isoprenylcysteine carboxylmethyltransferase family protein [Bacteriovoracaceae bacterium]